VKVIEVRPCKKFKGGVGCVWGSWRRASVSWPQRKAGRDSGQLYILLGLHVRDRTAYNRAFALCAHRGGNVETMSGCLRVRETFQEVVHAIDDGDYDVALKRHWW